LDFSNYLLFYPFCEIHRIHLLSDAINIFLNKVRLEGGMPFDIKVPSDRLKKAMKEAKEEDGTYHDSLDELVVDLKK
jgi:DNA-damage-inducible protein J